MRHIIIVLLCIFILGACTKEEVQKLPEPSRYKDAMGQYSFGLAVCKELSAEWVASIIKKTIISTEDFSGQNDTGCRYVTNSENMDNILVAVNYLDAESQKKGQEVLGRMITTEANIKMEHFIAKQKDGNINAIYLVLAPKKYVRLDRTSVKVVDNETLLTLAARIAEVIKPID